MAKAALDHNPAASPDAWNALGESLFAQSRNDEALFAFNRALKVSPDDVQARYNLACLHVARQQYPKALERLGEALGRDRHGGFRETLMHKQSEALALLAQQQQQHALSLANRILGSYAPPPKTEAPDGAPVWRPGADTLPGDRT